MIFADDQMQCIKRCGLSTVIITVSGRCLLGGCIYSLVCLLDVIPLLAFPVCGYDDNFSVFNSAGLKITLWF